MIIKPRYNGPQLPTEYAVRVTSAAPNGITVADDADIDMDTNNFGIALKRKLADWTPAVDTILLHKHDGTNGIIVTLLTTGIIRLTINLTNYDASAATGLAANANEWAVLSVVRESASVAGSVTRYIAGSVLDAASAITAGTPVTVSNASAMYIDGNSGEGFDIDDAGTILLNFAPAAAEVATLCTTGIPESWKWGSQAATWTSNWGAGVDGFVTITGTATITANVDGVSDGTTSKDNCLRINKTATAGLTGAAKTSGTLLPNTKNGWAKLSVYVPAGQAYIDGFIINRGSTISDSTTIFDGTGLNGQWVTVNGSAEPASANPSADRLYIFAKDGPSTTISASASGELLYIAEGSSGQAGATFAALPETIPTSGALEWPDSSGNTAGGTLPAAGATKVTIRR